MSGGTPSIFSMGTSTGPSKVGVKKQGLDTADAPGSPDASKQTLGAVPPGDSSALIKYNGASNEPGISADERIRRKRAEAGPGQLDPKTGRPMGVPEDLADIALRDASSGAVRKVRAGSTRDSILGSAMKYGVLLGIVGWVWLRAVLRGEL